MFKHVKLLHKSVYVCIRICVICCSQYFFVAYVLHLAWLSGYQDLLLSYSRVLIEIVEYLYRALPDLKICLQGFRVTLLSSAMQASDILLASESQKLYIRSPYQTLQFFLVGKAVFLIEIYDPNIFPVSIAAVP